MLFSQTSVHDPENLCGLDCLEIEEKHDKSDESVYEKFRKQLGQGPGGYYETTLIEKENDPPLRNNKVNSLERMKNLIRNLNRSKKVESYDKVKQSNSRKCSGKCSRN